MSRKIIQLLPSISNGDAVSNDVLQMDVFFKGIGLKSYIIAENIHPKISSKVICSKNVTNDFYKDSILIYHMAIGWDYATILPEIDAYKKIMRYHNITPQNFFLKFNYDLFKITQLGRQQLSDFKNTFDLAIADSDYNRYELEEIGYNNTITLPILVNFNDYDNPPDQKVLELYDDEQTNIVFVGRVAPNKKQEDVIKSFYYYKKYINTSSRLFLVGSYQGMENYYNVLVKYIRALNLTDVFFTGHISFAEVLAYYRIADAFLCMSEHEGFCVPLLESMYLKIPVLAYHSTAIPYTMGDSGIIFTEKNHPLIAEMINSIITNNEFKQQIITRQLRRLEDFDKKTLQNRFYDYLKEFI